MDCLGEDLQEGLGQLLPPGKEPTWPSQVDQCCSKLHDNELWGAK